MFNKNHKKIIVFFILIFIILIWSILLFVYSPEKIVDFLGISNAFIILFLMAFFGGTSILFPFPYYIFTISFGASGINPWLLGLFRGLGTFLGDSTTYFISYKAGGLIKGNLHKKFEQLVNWAIKKKPFVFPVIMFIYSSVMPLPCDLLIIPAGLMKYPYKKIVFSILFGKIIFNTLLAFSGLYGWSLIESIFI
jgi:membrane protein YqaA with SNARE-associated domain